MALQLRLLSVNVGQPRVIGERDGAPLLSAIGKEPVAAARIVVRRLGLDGDAQANLRVHGGPDKAVYAYPADHWSWWEQKRIACFPARFGENLTVEGAEETQVQVGDRFAWGDVVLEISQPRSPCNKLERYTGRPDVGALMTVSGRCGWYFRVVAEGDPPVRDAVLTRISTGNGPNLREVFHAVFNRRLPAEHRAGIAAMPALAAAWRERLA